MAVEQLEAENAEDICCYTCGKTPCEWLEFGTPALDAIEHKFNVETAIEQGYVVEVETGKRVPNNRIRFSFYQMFTYEKFGHLGRGNRIKASPFLPGMAVFIGVISPRSHIAFGCL